MGMVPFRGGAPAVADVLRRVLGVLWLADALVKILLPFGDRPGEESYEQIMTAEACPPGLHHVLAGDANTFLAHPFLWWLPSCVSACGWWPGPRAAGRWPSQLAGRASSRRSARA